MQLLSDDKTGIRFYAPQSWTWEKSGPAQWTIGNPQKPIGCFIVTILPEKLFAIDKQLWISSYLESEGIENFTVKESGKFALGESTINVDGKMYDLKYWMQFIDFYPVMVMYTCPLIHINKEDTICEQFINSFTSIQVN